jgi:hypothetical protein
VPRSDRYGPSLAEVLICILAGRTEVYNKNCVKNPADETTCGPLTSQKCTESATNLTAAFGNSILDNRTHVNGLLEVRVRPISREHGHRSIWQQHMLSFPNLKLLSY